jgi:hypothetical protein
LTDSYPLDGQRGAFLPAGVEIRVASNLPPVRVEFSKPTVILIVPAAPTPSEASSIAGQYVSREPWLGARRSERVGVSEFSNPYALRDFCADRLELVLELDELAAACH